MFRLDVLLLLTGSEQRVLEEKLKTELNFQSVKQAKKKCVLLPMARFYANSGLSYIPEIFIFFVLFQVSTL